MFCYPIYKAAAITATPSAAATTAAASTAPAATASIAQAVKWNLDMQMSPGSTNVGSTTNWKSVEVLDDYTIRVNLKTWQNMPWIKKACQALGFGGWTTYYQYYGSNSPAYDPALTSRKYDVAQAASPLAGWNAILSPGNSSFKSMKRPDDWDDLYKAAAATTKLDPALVQKAEEHFTTMPLKSWSMPIPHPGRSQIMSWTPG